MQSDDLVHRYMTGSCHALAYVLSELLSKPVGILQARRHGEEPIPDPLHVFVILGDGLVLDVKGQRTKLSMEEDFTSLLSLLKTHEGDVLTLRHGELSWASELYEDLNFDSSKIRKASIDLGNGLWDELKFAGKPDIEADTIPRIFSKVSFEDDHSFGF